MSTQYNMQQFVADKLHCRLLFCFAKFSPFLKSVSQLTNKSNDHVLETYCTKQTTANKYILSNELICDGKEDVNFGECC